MKLKVKRLTDTAKLPVKAHTTDAGFDIFADETVPLFRDKTDVISTGIAIEIPEGYYGKLTGRSGLTSKTPIRIQEGTIDSSYRGELKIMCDLKPFMRFHEGKSVHLDKSPDYQFVVGKGDKIAQLIIQPLPNFDVEEVDGLNESDRGQGGFGSTGG